MKSQLIITFGNYHSLSPNRDAIEYGFYYTTLDARYVGLPEAPKKVEPRRLIVGISRTLATVWAHRGVENGGLVKTLFEIGKRHVIQKVKDGTLAELEEVQLSTANQSNDPPFDPSLIPDPKGYKETVTIDEPGIMEGSPQLQIGGRIVDTLDNINVLFHSLHGEFLFLPREFRAPLEFIRPASTKEEFAYRIISLAQLLGQLNTQVLQRETKTTDTQIKSISLLQNYMEGNGSKHEMVIPLFRAIMRARQAYPVHTDIASGVVEAHTHLGIEFPVSQFKDSWIEVLKRFLSALEVIELALKNNAVSPKKKSKELSP